MQYKKHIESLLMPETERSYSLMWHDFCEWIDSLDEDTLSEVFPFCEHLLEKWPLNRRVLPEHWKNTPKAAFACTEIVQIKGIEHYISDNYSGSNEKSPVTHLEFSYNGKWLAFFMNAVLYRYDRENEILTEYEEEEDLPEQMENGFSYWIPRDYGNILLSNLGTYTAVNFSGILCLYRGTELIFKDTIYQFDEEDMDIPDAPALFAFSSDELRFAWLSGESELSTLDPETAEVLARRKLEDLSAFTFIPGKHVLLCIGESRTAEGVFNCDTLIRGDREPYKMYLVPNRYPCYYCCFHPEKKVFAAFEPYNSPWYDREDHGPVYGEFRLVTWKENDLSTSKESGVPFKQGFLYRWLRGLTAQGMVLLHQENSDEDIQIYESPQDQSFFVRMDLEFGALVQLDPESGMLVTLDKTDLLFTNYHTSDDPENIKRNEQLAKTEFYIKRMKKGGLHWDTLTALLDSMDRETRKQAVKLLSGPVREKFRVDQRVPLFHWKREEPLHSLGELYHIPGYPEGWHKEIGSNPVVWESEAGGFIVIDYKDIWYEKTGPDAPLQTVFREEENDWSTGRICSHAAGVAFGPHDRLTAVLNMVYNIDRDSTVPVLKEIVTDSRVHIFKNSKHIHSIQSGPGGQKFAVGPSAFFIFSPDGNHFYYYFTAEGVLHRLDLGSPAVTAQFPIKDLTSLDVFTDPYSGSTVLTAASAAGLFAFDEKLEHHTQLKTSIDMNSSFTKLTPNKKGTEFLCIQAVEFESDDEIAKQRMYSSRRSPRAKEWKYTFFKWNRGENNIFNGCDCSIKQQAEYSVGGKMFHWIDLLDVRCYDDCIDVLTIERRQDPEYLGCDTMGDRYFAVHRFPQNEHFEFPFEGTENAALSAVRGRLFVNRCNAGLFYIDFEKFKAGEGAADEK